MEEIKQELNQRVPTHLVDELLSIPEVMKVAEEQLIGINLKITDRKKQVEMWELEEMRKVAESEEEGKRKYPNAEIRSAELERRKRGSQEYQKYSLELYEAEHSKRVQEVLLNYCDRKFKAMRTISELIARR